MEPVAEVRRPRRVRSWLLVSVAILSGCSGSPMGDSAASTSVAASTNDASDSTVPSVAGSRSDSSPEGDLAAARTRWRDSGIENYTFEADTRDCECSFGGCRLVTVIGGEVVHVYSI